MKKNFFKNFWLAAVFLIFIFVAIPLPAGALFGEAKILFNALNLFFTVVNSVIGWIGGLLFSLASMFVNIAFDINLHIVSSANPVVSIGWGIVRDIANLGFVLVIIIIAFATILRIQKYGAKDLLSKLIVAAVLVNFSLLIGKVFIDFANVFTQFFLNAASISPKNLAVTLAGAFDIQKLLMASTNPTTPSPPPDFENVGEAFFIGIASILFTFLFTVVGAIVLFILAILFFIRFFELSFLLVISPITWLFWIVPQWSEQTKKWWNSFIKWVFFAPAASFFVYLAVRSAQVLKDHPITIIQSDMYLGLAGPLETIFTQGAQMFLILAILVGGLIAAQSMGIGFADTTVKWAGTQGKAMGSKTKAWAGRKAASGRDRLLTARTDEEGKTALERAGGKKIFGKELRTIPVVGRAFTGISGVSSRAKEKLAKGTEEEYKKAKSRTSEDLVATADRQMPTARPQELSGLGLAIAEKKGAWDKLKKSTQDRILKALKQTNSGDEFLKHQPQYAQAFNKDIGQVMKRVPDVSDLNKESLGKPEIANNLSLNHISQLDFAPKEKKDAVAAAWITTLGDNDLNKGFMEIEDIKKYQKTIDTLKQDIADQNSLAQAAPAGAAKQAAQAKLANLIKQKQTTDKSLKSKLDAIKSEPDKNRAWSNYESASQRPHWRNTISYTP